MGVGGWVKIGHKSARWQLERRACHSAPQGVQKQRNTSWGALLALPRLESLALLPLQHGFLARQ